MLIRRGRTIEELQFDISVKKDDMSSSDDTLKPNDRQTEELVSYFDQRISKSSIQ